MSTKEKKQTENIDDTINPEDIVFNEQTDDSDMPEPQTKDYSRRLRCKPLFMTLFTEMVNDLPYATILKNQKGEQIKLVDIVKYVETKHESMDVSEMDKIISFIATIDFKHARPIMEKIENSEQQKDLFEII